MRRAAGDNYGHLAESASSGAMYRSGAPDIPTHAGFFADRTQLLGGESFMGFVLQRLDIVGAIAIRRRSSHGSDEDPDATVLRSVDECDSASHIDGRSSDVSGYLYGANRRSWTSSGLV